MSRDPTAPDRVDSCKVLRACGRHDAAGAETVWVAWAKNSLRQRHYLAVKEVMMF